MSKATFCWRTTRPGTSHMNGRRVPMQADGSSSDNENHPPLTLGPPCVRPALHVAVEVVADKDVFWFCPVSSMDCRGRVSQSQLLRQGQYLHLQLSSAIFGPANILINHLEQIQLNNGINHWIWHCWNHVKHDNVQMRRQLAGSLIDSLKKHFQVGGGTSRYFLWILNIVQHCWTSSTSNLAFLSGCNVSLHSLPFSKVFSQQWNLSINPRSFATYLDGRCWFCLKE